jgi:hypothetical protein
MRMIGSTVAGEGPDSILFIMIAFLGVLPASGVLALIVFRVVFKVASEMSATPFTCAIINYPKRSEKIDVYDRGIDYNPFLLRDQMIIRLMPCPAFHKAIQYCLMPRSDVSIVPFVNNGNV